MSKKLEACPFCGADAAVKLDALSGCYTYLCCNLKCGADVVFRGAEGALTRKRSDKLWNRRHVPTCRIADTRFDDGYLQYEMELSCGHSVFCDEMRGPNHCPECGALVVRS